MIKASRSVLIWLSCTLTASPACVNFERKLTITTPDNTTGAISPVTSNSQGSDQQNSSGGTSAPQQPLLITFDLHADPMNGISMSMRKSAYQTWLNNAVWLLDTADTYGAKISFLSAGEFMEYCVEDSQNCFPVLKRLQQSGNIIGTHCHQEYRAGDNHNWANYTMGSITDSQVKTVWNDAKTWVDKAIQGAFNLSDLAQISAINTASMCQVPDSHADTTPLHAIQQDLGYTIKEGGADQELFQYFGHTPFNVFRPGTCNICEDLSGPVVTVPQSQVIGDAKNHFGVYQDGRAARKQVEILQALINSKIHVLSNKGPKIWSYGWGVHNSDLDANTEGRNSIITLLPWIKENLVDKGLAKFVSYTEARDLYLEWEKANPGVSSFNYSEKTMNYSKYPYSEIANKYLRYANFDKRVDVGNSVIDAFQLTAQLKDSTSGTSSGNAYKLVLISRADAAASFNLSSVFGSNSVRVTRLDNGETATFASNNISVGVEPVAICNSSECDAILAFNSASTTTTPAPGPSCMPAPGPSGMPAPGPSGMPAPGPSGMPAPGPSGMPAPGPSGMPAPGPSGAPTANPCSSSYTYYAEITIGGTTKPAMCCPSGQTPASGQCVSISTTTQPTPAPTPSAAPVPQPSPSSTPVVVQTPAPTPVPAPAPAAVPTISTAVTFSKLNTYHSSCSSTQAYSDSCFSAINAYCRAEGYATGFGPVEHYGDSAIVVCIPSHSAKVVATTYSSLVAFHSSCTTSSPYGDSCNSAINAYCQKNGYKSGFGPTDHVGDSVNVACVSNAIVTNTTYTTLKTHHNDCTTSSSFGDSCNAAINRFCQSKGYVSGFGPTDHINDSVNVACVSAM